VTVFIATFEALATLFVIGGVGFWIVRRGLVPGQVLRALSAVAIEVALPCLVFVRIIRGLDAAQKPDWWIWPLAFLGFLAWAGTLTAVSSRLVRRSVRREFAFALLFQNVTFLPLAILTQTQGEDSTLIVELFLFALLFSPVFFNTYPLFFARGPRPRWGKTVHPVVVASALAVALSMFGAAERVPGFLVSSLELVGNMAVPLLMLVLGGNLYVEMRMPGTARWSDAAKFVLVKNALFPAATLVVLLWLRLPRQFTLLLLLQSTVPPIASLPIFVGREGGDVASTSRFVLASFAFSLVSIPTALAIFEAVFPAG
jgi:hypothetical protein